MNRPIIALDFAEKEKVQLFLAKFPKYEFLYVKVGMELFYQEGPDIVRWLHDLGHDVFLDLKLHDIPNTVEKAMKGLANLGISMTNVHAAGGKEMMTGAIAGLQAGSSKKVPKLLAVTQLTSTNQEQIQREQGILTSLESSVIHYAQLAQQSGLAGVVCSALEVLQIKANTAQDFICLTPGIRPVGTVMGDQKRVVTPGKAKRIGSDYIVVGRAITNAVNPYEAYTKIKNEWKDG